MTCYSFDALVEFAMDPLKPEHAELAAHLLSCKDCRREFNIAMGTGENEEENKAFSAEFQTLLKKKEVWTKFHQFIDNIAEKMQGAFGMVNLSRVMQPQASMLFAAASPAAKPAFQTKFGEKPAITFEAETPNYSDYYWKAQMTFPTMVSSHAMIQMQLSGKEGKPLNNGTLLFLGKEFNIIAGVSTIPFKEFVKERKSNSIGVRFNDGCQTDGTIKFLPESFS